MLDHALAHFLDAFRAVHAGGWRSGVDEVRSLLTNAPRGAAPDELDRQVRRHRSSTKHHSRSNARSPRLGPVDPGVAFRASCGARAAPSDGRVVLRPCRSHTVLRDSVDEVGEGQIVD